LSRLIQCKLAFGSEISDEQLYPAHGKDPSLVMTTLLIGGKRPGEEVDLPCRNVDLRED
jgi:hypothetical protein